VVARLDWLAGLSPDAIDEVRLMLADEAASRAMFEKEREELLAASPAALAKQWAPGLPPGDDPAFLVDEAVCMQQAMAAGIEGSWDDCRAQIIPWGFGVDQISIPVLLMHGRRDKAVPFSHGQWLAAHIPGVDARLFDNEGHGTAGEPHR
jgi:pimeloyl-ACP methyl ester carboxylesterase